MAEYLEENQPWQIQKGEAVAMCWALAANYWTLLINGQHPQGEGKESRAAVATQTAAEPVPAVSSIQNNTSRTKSVCVVRGEEGAGPSQPEEEAGPEIIT